MATNVNLIEPYDSRLRLHDIVSAAHAAAGTDRSSQTLEELRKVKLVNRTRTDETIIPYPPEGLALPQSVIVVVEPVNVVCDLLGRPHAPLVVRAPGRGFRGWGL